MQKNSEGYKNKRKIFEDLHISLLLHKRTIKTFINSAKNHPPFWRMVPEF